MSDGATRADDGSFVFTAVPGGNFTIESDGSASGEMRFQGTITFDAHGGMLQSTLTELGVEVGADRIVMTVLEAPLNRDRCEIAKLSVANVGADGETTLRAEITMDGMYQIADNYPPGTELDPVRLD